MSARRSPKRMLKKFTSGVLVAQKPQRTFLYASTFSLLAALLSKIFEHPFLA